jgi:hypothetical protein
MTRGGGEDWGVFHNEEADCTSFSYTGGTRIVSLRGLAVITKVFHSFAQHLKPNSGIIPSKRPRQNSSMLLLIYLS